MYVASRKACSGGRLPPGSERDDGSPDGSGRTVVDFGSGGGGGGGFASIQGLPIFKPPYGRITAVDMNTGEAPNGDTPERITNHPVLEGVDIPNTGFQGNATALVTRSLLMFAEGRGGQAVWFGVNKAIGERIGSVVIPAPTSTAPMTYMHEGMQYIVLPVAAPAAGILSSLVALRLPQP